LPTVSERLLCPKLAMDSAYLTCISTVDVLLEVKLESVFSVPDLSFVAAIDTRSPAPYQCLYSGLLAATAGHVWIGRAVEILMYQVAVESTGLLLDPWEETLSFLSLHFDVKSLELWRLRAYSCITDYPLGLVAHQLFGHSSPFQSLHPGLVKVTAHSNALFLLVCIVSTPSCLWRDFRADWYTDISADERTRHGCHANFGCHA
jgi:hypothetical protein